MEVWWSLCAGSSLSGSFPPCTLNPRTNEVQSAMKSVAGLPWARFVASTRSFASPVILASNNAVLSVAHSRLRVKKILSPNASLQVALEASSVESSAVNRARFLIYCTANTVIIFVEVPPKLVPSEVRSRSYPQ